MKWKEFPFFQGTEDKAQGTKWGPQSTQDFFYSLLSAAALPEESSESFFKMTYLLKTKSTSLNI